MKKNTSRKLCVLVVEQIRKIAQIIEKNVIRFFKKTRGRAFIY